MMNSLTFKLEGNPPSWAKEARWYHENVHGEHWIATIQKDRVLISGLDIGWDEIILNRRQAEEALHILSGMERPTDHFFRENPIASWILDKGESIWVASVLAVAVEEFKMLSYLRKL